LNFASQSSPPFLATAHAKGTLTADRVRLGSISMTRVSTNAELDKAVLRLSNLHFDVLGGKHLGDWQADFSRNPPVYNGAGIIEHAVLRQLAEAMNDGWITGSANARYELKFSGSTVPDLLASAAGKFAIEAHDGSLPHIMLTSDSGPLQMRRLQAQFLLRNDTLQVEKGSLETSAGIYQVSGSASSRQVMNFKLTRDPSHIFNVTGPLSQPRISVVRSPETEAALKP
jgi:uncharacterized protein involved in outer membrane biogenesis